ncbi:MAG: hypothetical protein ACYC7L_04180 [Nitrospirota bacterium]
MPTPDRIKHFVRKTLGCSCPDDVFASIEVRGNVRLNSFITLEAVISIGHRLIVYVAGAGSAGCIEEHLPVLVGAGKKERDEKGLNRFRLVLVAADPEGLQNAAERQFEELRGSDEKVHLHVISKANPFFTAESAERAEEDGMPC